MLGSSVPFKQGEDSSIGDGLSHMSMSQRSNNLVGMTSERLLAKSNRSKKRRDQKNKSPDESLTPESNRTPTRSKGKAKTIINTIQEDSGSDRVS